MVSTVTGRTCGAAIAGLDLCRPPFSIFGAGDGVGSLAEVGYAPGGYAMSGPQSGCDSGERRFVEVVSGGSGIHCDNFARNALHQRGRCAERSAAVRCGLRNWNLFCLVAMASR